MKYRQRNLPVYIGALLVLLFGAKLLTLAFEPSDIWWTNSTKPLSLAQAKDRLEVRVDGTMLQKAVGQGRLHVRAADGKMRAVGTKDVTVRLNNWDSRRASLYGGAIFDAVLLTSGIWLIIFGLKCSALRGNDLPA